MRFYFAVLLLALTFHGCSSPAQSPSPGLAAVLAVYGGRAAESAGVVASTDSNDMSGRFFEISLARGAEVLRPEFQDLSEPALNAAYLFYHTLTPEQRKGYAFGRIVLEDEKDSPTYEFSVADLRYAEQGMVQVQHLMDRAIQQDYATIIDKGNPAAASKAEWEKVGASFPTADQQYGRVKKFSSRGLALFDQAIPGGTKHLLSVTARVRREREGLPLILIVDPATSAEGSYLYGLEFFDKKTK